MVESISNLEFENLLKRFKEPYMVYPNTCYHVVSESNKSRYFIVLQKCFENEISKKMFLNTESKYEQQTTYASDKFLVKQIIDLSGMDSNISFIGVETIRTICCW